MLQIFTHIFSIIEDLLSYITVKSDNPLHRGINQHHVICYQSARLVYSMSFVCPFPYPIYPSSPGPCHCVFYGFSNPTICHVTHSVMHHLNN